MSNSTAATSQAPPTSPSPSPTAPSPSPSAEPTPSEVPTPSPSAEPSVEPSPSPRPASEPATPDPSPPDPSPDPSTPSPDPPAPQPDDNDPDDQPDDQPNDQPDDQPDDQPPDDQSPVGDPPTDNEPDNEPPDDEPDNAPPAVIVTSSVIAERPDPTTELITSVITTGSIVAGDDEVTVVLTSVNEPTVIPVPDTSEPAPSTSSTRPAALQSGEASDDDDGGLSPAGVTAVAVVVPIVVVALLILGGIFWWRRRKQRKSTEEARRKEVEEYGYNPNHDPALPAVAGSEMAEDKDGYRGWGNTTNPSNPSNRKGSTTISGMTGSPPSDSGSQPRGGSASPDSPTLATYSDRYSTDPLVFRNNNNHANHEPDTVAALGGAPAAGANPADVRRGPSNASSHYSAAGHSDRSGEGTTPPIVLQPGVDYNADHAFGHAGPFPEPHQPVIRDVTARRNTRIENPVVYPHQGNMGIAQNF